MLVGWLFRCGLCCYLPERERDRNGYRSMTSANSHRPPWRGEDEPLLRGRGRFIDDAPLPGPVYGWFVRSTHAYGKIRPIDIAAARAPDGVLAVRAAPHIKASRLRRL